MGDGIAVTIHILQEVEDLTEDLKRVVRHKRSGLEEINFVRKRNLSILEPSI